MPVVYFYFMFLPSGLFTGISLQLELSYCSSNRNITSFFIKKVKCAWESSSAILSLGFKGKVKIFSCNTALLKN